ncbi:hypothetical protein NJI34_13650 [Pseudomonas sp. S 311-6]|nr:hypothetical protein [Pseudomonas sp. S 311-6]
MSKALPFCDKVLQKVEVDDGSKISSTERFGSLTHVSGNITCFIMVYSEGEKIVLKGTHGTSRSRAEVISSKGFVATTKECVLMSGVYFWAYDNEISLAKRLAENWWRFSSVKLKSYVEDSDCSLAVLDARIEANENVYFDASAESFLDLLIKTAEARGIESTKQEFNKLRVLLLTEIEAFKKTTFCVIKAEVEVPGKVSGESSAPFVYWAAKQAPCYVVTNTALNLINHVELVEE